jgi:hypothetical protein
VISGSQRYSLCLRKTKGFISETTGEPGPKRSLRKTPVDQKGSWPSKPGPVGDSEYTTIKFLEEHVRINGLSALG